MSDPKLKELTRDGNFQAKVSALMSDLEAHGEKPKVFETKRTKAQQAEKVRLGYSKTMNSYHRKVGSDGLAKAADVADAVKGWNARKRFWLRLGSSAMAHDIGWGGLFGLNGKQKAKLKTAIAMLRSAGWPDEHPAYACQVGWDTAHLENRSNWP